MNFIRPFAPHYGSTQTVTPAAASATIPIAKQDEQVRILNTGTGIAFVRVGDSTASPVVATAADFPIAPGDSTTITKSVLANTLAHISDAGTTLVICTGNGF